MREFRKATTEITTEMTAAAQKPEPPAVTTPPESAAKGSTSEANSPKS